MAGGFPAALVCQYLLDHLADHAAFGAQAGGLEFGLNGLHHRAHLFGGGLLAGGGGDFGNGFSDEGLERGLVESLGQELLDDGDLGGFRGGQLGAVALW